MSVLTNLNNIQKNIQDACKKVNRSSEDINIIGVTKYVTIDRARELLDAGITDLGENRAEELIYKYKELDDQANYHFIGTLQSRKVKDIINIVTSIHSLDRLSIAKQINNRSNKIIDCFVQVNVSEEETKHGIEIKKLNTFIDQLAEYEKVRVVGLMTMAPDITDKNEIRIIFRQLAELRDEIKNRNLKHAPCNYLSMGMSNDYEIAIEEGATHIRIGSKLVGN